MEAVHFKHYPGLGEDEYPGFPTEACPPEMPNLAKHHSLMADVLKVDPGLYEALRERRTVLGTGLAKCIKTGIDNRGHPMIKTLGLVAGDDECYETFRPLFDAVIRARHGDECLAQNHPTDLSLDRVTRGRADPSGRCVLSTQVRLMRSLRGVRFPSAISFCERREVERVCVRALLELEGTPMQGEYYPLAGSQSYGPKRGGVTAEEEEALLREQLLFSHPDSTMALCSGVGRHWPDARGVFVSTSRSFSVRINEEEHLRVQAVRPRDGLQEAFVEAANVLQAIEASLNRHGDFSDGFARSERLGFVTSCPSNLGSAMRIGVTAKLPLVAEKEGLAMWCAGRRLAVRGAVDDSGAQLSGVLEVSNRDRLGMSEVDTLNLVVEAVAELVRIELYLEAGGQEATFEELTTAVAPSNLTPTLPAGEEEAIDYRATGQTLGYLFAGAVSQIGKALAGLDLARSAVRLTLEDALASGKLQMALDECEGEKQERELAEERRQQGEHLRTKIWNVLETSLDNGELERVLVASDECVWEKRERELAEERRQQGEHLRARLWNVLETSLDNGELQKVLAASDGVGAGAGAAAQETIPPHHGHGAAELDRVKTLAQDAIMRALDLDCGGADGSDDASGEGTHQAAEAPASRVADIRSRMRLVLEEAVDDGSLDQALAANNSRQDAGSDLAKQEVIDDLYKKLGSGLVECLQKGGLEGWPKAGGYKDIAVAGKAEALLALLPTATSLARKEPLSQAARAVVEALCNSERRIGALTAAICLAHKRIAESDAQAAQLRVQLDGARSDVRCLTEELEQRQRRIDEAGTQSIRLHEGQQRLMGELSTVSLKLRHTYIDVDPMPLYSSRSDISTACTMNEGSPPAQATPPRLTSGEPPQAAATETRLTSVAADAAT